MQKLCLCLTICAVLAAGSCGNGKKKSTPNATPATDNGAVAEDAEAEVSEDIVDAQPEDSGEPEPADLYAPEAAGPFVKILSPLDGEVAHNPVLFEFVAGNGVVKVAFFVDDLPLQGQAMEASAGGFSYDFKGVNVLRHLALEGYGEDGLLAASDQLNFIPSEGYIPEPPGFNAYVLRAINDWTVYPKNGTYPYCWKECPGSMGVIHDVTYLDTLLWPGEGSCFCTGFTLELFLDGIRRWQGANGMDPIDPLHFLSVEAVDKGTFYQHWQGYGVATSASAADAFEAEEIGHSISEESWEEALPGDFVNLSRTDGTGHSVVFVAWLREGGEIIGIRYFGCNSSGDSHPDTYDSSNVKGISGPSFTTEKFVSVGGKVIPSYLYVGHVVDPLVGY